MDLCSHCQVQGFLAEDLDDQPGEVVGLRMLFPTQSDEILCFLCLMRAESCCFHCLNQAELVVETRCQARPMLCKTCVANPTTIHVWDCYGSGCMTPEEFALEVQRELEEDSWNPENSA